MKTVHTLIATTAKAIAHEAYETLAHDNAFFAHWPNREAFVQKNWTMFVGDARNSLMQLLAVDHWEGDQPVYVYPEEMREPAYQALLIDGSQKKDPHASPVRTKTRTLH